MTDPDQPDLNMTSSHRVGLVGGKVQFSNLNRSGTCSPDLVAFLKPQKVLVPFSRLGGVRD